VLLRLAHLGVTNAFALLRLLPCSDQDKDAEILVWRHQIAVPQRQLGDQHIRFQPADRALLTALLHPLPRPALQRLRLLIRPDTILRWHRDPARRRHPARSRPPRLEPGSTRRSRPRSGAVPSTLHRLPPAGDRHRAGCRRRGTRHRHGDAGSPSTPRPAAPHPRQRLDHTRTYHARLHAALLGTLATARLAAFLRSPADALLACDFFETSL
jgi:hypothetical protein